METIVKVDDKGRILIPSEMRKRLGIRNAVRLRLEGNKLLVEPIRDPVELLASSMINGTRDVEKELAELRREAYKEALRRLSERWH